MDGPAQISLPPSGPRPLPTVYSYYLPEVRAVADRVLTPLPHQVLLRNVHPGLDRLHEPLVEAYADRFGAQLRGWDAFPHRYPTGGASEALFHLLAAHVAGGDRGPLYQLPGEYQGYQAYAEALGTSFTTRSVEQLAGAPPGRLFVSHPSARDGNLIEPAALRALLDRHRTVLDLAYLGTSRPLDLELDHPNVDAVLLSMSKPYGLYYHRIGVCLARRPLASLYGNRWFKNAMSLVLGTEVLRALDPERLRARYSGRQREAVARASADLGVELAASDVWLLAHLPAGEPAPVALEPFRRGDGHRVCLTAYLMAMEAEGS